jgi:SAM-dependent methyltransferase
MPLRPIKKIRKGIQRQLHSRFGVLPLNESQEDIQAWFAQDLGQRILADEQKCLDSIMPEMYGYHLMQLSVLNNVVLSQQSPVTHHFSLGLQQAQAAGALADFQHLPIEAESIDVAILHHVLDYSPNPHQLLRETARSIIPNGNIIIIGFNPFTGLSLKKQFGRVFIRSAHWRYQNLRSSRLIDWLRVLDFEPMVLRHGYYGMPFNRGYRQGYDKFFSKMLPSSGAFYMIVARKSVIPMTLIKQPWKKSKRMPVWAKGTAISRNPAHYLSENSQFSDTTKDFYGAYKNQNDPEVLH